MKYKYSARDVNGSTVKGEMEAADAGVIAAALKEKKLTPVSVVKMEGLDLEAMFSRWDKVSDADVANFTRQLSTMVTAGLPLTDALNLLKLQSGRAMSTVVGGLMTDVQAGLALSESMAKYPQAFSKVYVALMKAGEAAGSMDTILNRLADTMEKSREFKAKIISAMIYPVIVLVGMIGVVGLMMVVVVPKLTSIYSEFNADLPLATKIVIAVSNFIAGYWWLLLALLVGGGAAFNWYINSPAGRKWWDGIIYKIPVLGPLNKQVMLTELTRTLALLVGAGVAIVDGINIVAGALGNVVIEAQMRLIGKKVEKGFPISVSFSEAGEFPPIMGQMIAVGEETGKLDDVLMKVSKYLESESEQKVKGLTSAIEPLIIVILGLGVGFLMFAIIMPIYNLTSKF